MMYTNMLNPDLGYLPQNNTVIIVATAEYTDSVNTNARE